MAAAEARYGQIDVLVTAAGIFQARAFLDYPLEDWQRIVDVNLTGTMLACQAALRRMVPRKSGRILTLASAVGRSPGRFRTGYSATKHAVVGLTRCLALEFAAQGITANALCPGMIETPMYEQVLRQDGELSGERDLEAARLRLMARSPQGRMIHPDEIAGLAAYLASPEARSFTGQAVGLDGGMVMT
jgi:NAD(P)-dependent dehydrogenase (short-subunit alcohol dehydrogenase family)